MADGTFDFVIVGAGSAGCVLANRLSADPANRVLLLEAGGSDRSFWIHTPLGYGKTFYDPAVNWMYLTDPDEGTAGRKSYWPRGKVLGGSSSINAMVYIRGQHEDYDDWASMGNPGWGWEDVLPYFRKSETFSGGGNKFRGDAGPLYVSDVSRHYHDVNDYFLDSAQACGLPLNPDFNGVSQFGVGEYQITARNGRRMSAARAFLRPARSRPNLSVETSAHVTRILFESGAAVGVEYLKGGQIRRAHAAREVIVSGGAVNSPQLLELSGIGDGALLREYGIQTVRHSPAVGENLQDHLGLTHYYRSRVPTLNNTLRPWWGKLGAGMQYVFARRGPLAVGVNQAGGFFRSRPDRPRPNLQLYFCPMTFTRQPPDRRTLLQPDDFAGFLNSISQCRPTSRGYLHIRSTDPLEPVRICPNYLTTDSDVEEMVEGARFLRQIAATRPLADIIEEELTPGTGVESDEELIDDLRKRAVTVFHPTSTCSMGPNSDTSVVNHLLQVHGVDRLRVVDASVFPTVISGNTNGPVIMLAERAADLILQKY